MGEATARGSSVPRIPPLFTPLLQLSQPNNKFALIDNALNAASFSVAAPVAPAAAVASA